jgi:4'-phosphopantetheinyl transferase
MTGARQLLTHDPEALIAARTPLRTQPDTVHVWAFSLEGSAHCVEACRSLLSADERERADRFAFPHLRSRYTVAHGVLRRLLGRYCGVPAETLQFSTAASGKPALLAARGDPYPIAFNLTHSEACGAVGITTRGPLGIDIEKVREEVDALAISRSYFFGTERTAIASAPPDSQTQAFFRYWVAKEAVLKAQGVGLGFPLDHFRVEFVADGTTGRIVTLDPGRLSGDWTVRELPLAPGWAGAVAAAGAGWALEFESL